MPQHTTPTTTKAVDDALRERQRAEVDRLGRTADYLGELASDLAERIRSVDLDQEFRRGAWSGAEHSAKVIAQRSQALCDEVVKMCNAERVIYDVLSDIVLSDIEREARG